MALQAVFVRNIVYPERRTISGRTGTSRKEYRDYRTYLEDLTISNTSNTLR
jgi:hypothetical protein